MRIFKSVNYPVEYYKGGFLNLIECTTAKEKLSVS